MFIITGISNTCFNKQLSKSGKVNETSGVITNKLFDTTIDTECMPWR